MLFVTFTNSHLKNEFVQKKFVEVCSEKGTFSMAYWKCGMQFLGESAWYGVKVHLPIFSIFL